MKKWIGYISLILTFCLFAPESLKAKNSKKVNQFQNQNWKRKFVANQFVVKFKSKLFLGKSKSGIPSVDKILNKNNVYGLEPIWKNKNALRKVNSSIGIENIYIGYFSGNRSPEEITEKLSLNENIEYAEPLPIYRINVIPDDPFYGNQSYLDIIKAPEAWDIVKSEQSDVVIAVIDGGTYINHPDLKANLWENPDEIPDNEIDDDQNGLTDDIHGWNFANDSNDPTGLDNTPINANHGTQTAGIACAVSNNGIGVSGSSWNAKLMAINASASDVDTAIVFGYAGVLYAAIEGADIISLSWGGTDVAPQFVQDIISFAIESGAAVVAAAGNNENDEPHYPSSLPDVLSVAATNPDDSKARFSNYGTDIDVAAPGVNIYTVNKNGNYSLFRTSGTSFSTPLVAGIAALVKTQHLNWTGIQITEQIRVTSDNIDLKNPSFIGQLGNGRINAFRAVTDTTQPSIRITSVSISDENGNGIIQPGENVDVNLSFFNYLYEATSVNVKLSENDPYISLLSDNSVISSIEMLSEATLTSSLSFQVPLNTPRNHKIKFEIELSVGNYSDNDQFELIVLPNYANTFVNNISTTITNKGRIGFADTKNQTDGIGFHHLSGANLLFEGSIIAGTGPVKLVDAARSVRDGDNIQYHDDFWVSEDGELQVISPGNISDFETKTIYTDEFAPVPLGLQITQETFAWNSDAYKDFIIFRYNIVNTGTETLDNFHFGLFFDWDIDGSTYGTNIADFDSDYKLGYAMDDSQNGPETYVGIALISDDNISYRAIFNDEKEPNNPSWGIYDGFEKSEKWEAISGGTSLTTAGPSDISHAIGSGPHTIFPNRSTEVAFALVAGENLQSIQTSTDSAKSLYKREIPAADPNQIPIKFELIQNFPNPFKPQENPTLIQYKIPEVVNVELVIYNLLGQQIKTIVQEKQSATVYTYQWNGLDESGKLMPSGVYFYRLKAGDFIETKKLLLVR